MPNLGAQKYLEDNEGKKVIVHLLKKNETEEVSHSNNVNHCARIYVYRTVPTTVRSVWI